MKTYWIVYVCMYTWNSCRCYPIVLFQVLTNYLFLFWKVFVSLNRFHFGITFHFFHFYWTRCLWWSLLKKKSINDLPSVKTNSYYTNLYSICLKIVACMLAIVSMYLFLENIFHANFHLNKRKLITLSKH